MPIQIGPNKIGLATFRKQNQPYLDALDMLEKSLRLSVDDSQRQDKSISRSRSSQQQRSSRSRPKPSPTCTGRTVRMKHSRSLPIYIRTSMDQFLHLTDLPTNLPKNQGSLDSQAVKEEYALADHYYHPSHDFTEYINADVRNNASAAFNRR